VGENSGDGLALGIFSPTNVAVTASSLHMVESWNGAERGMPTHTNGLLPNSVFHFEFLTSDQDTKNKGMVTKLRRRNSEQQTSSGPL
jgi:hypothetical protein